LDENIWQVSTNFIVNGVDIHNEVTCPRYKKAYSTLQGCNGALDQAGAMDLMKFVSVGGTTWSFVYNLTDKTMRVSLNRAYESVYTYVFSLQSFTV